MFNKEFNIIEPIIILFNGDFMIAGVSIKKIRIVGIISLVSLVAISGKLTYETIIRNQYLSDKAQDLWERSFPIAAPRGIIYDRNNNPVAINNPTYSIAVIPFQIESKEVAAKEIASIIGANEEKILEKISKKASIVRLHPEGRRISIEEANKINDLHLKGVYLINDNERYYPYGESMASLLGFVGIDNQGLAGVESYYDYYLKGVDGSLNYLTDAKGGLFENKSSRLVAPLDGLSLNLTIDINIQNIIEREMKNAWIKYSPKEIIALAMDPNNGEILAIGNRPTYDNNDYSNYDPEIYNRTLAVFSSFEPGSTFKAITFASALDAGVIDMDKDYYYDKGYEIVGGARIKSWKKGGHGLQTFLEVLQNSSNPGFVEIARRMGKDRLYGYYKDFGVGEKTGVDISGESKGIMFNYDKYGVLEQATSAFGQGVSLTAIQLAAMFSATINGGYLYTPHIAKSISSGFSNEIIYTFSNEAKRQVIKKTTSDLMRRALECVVALGSGKKAYLDGYRVGGKTGTAQIAENGIYQKGRYVLSFIAAAPMDDPKIVIYFAMREPKNTIQYGGTTVGPIIQTILSEALPILKVRKRESPIERTYTWMDTKSYVVDNYIGKDKKDVKSKYFKFVYFGEGNKVINQEPQAGEHLKEGSTIMILLGEDNEN